MENPEKIEIAGLKTIHKLCKFGADHNMEGCTFTEIVERMFSKIEQMKTQVNTLDEMLLNQGEVLAQAKAQAVPEGFEIGRLQDRIVELLDERQDLYAQINKGVAEKIELIIRDVAELPDRTSPEDWPEALIVTSGELEEILTQHLIQKCRNQEQGE
ncbi:hypothetical protein N5I05_04530 [Acinetobacter johnsonii]|uniref:hypothetical protein n=1 Tax=Acinetobacter johnsonii TaxID=40214 RepID=UPI00244B0802|nr:hypothetical protein [Acinetobacter johnsonii]MDH1697819.1 hypothetical protein [Acinetobacter johnsonii]